MWFSQQNHCNSITNTVPRYTQQCCSSLDKPLQEGGKLIPTNYFMAVMLLINDSGKDLCTYPYFSYSFPKRFFTTAGDTTLRYLEGDKSSLCLSRKAFSTGFTQCLMHPPHTETPNNLICSQQSIPAVAAHPSNTPLSNEFLMSLTSTWEPGTLKMPCCWRPGKEQWFRGDFCNCVRGTFWYRTAEAMSPCTWKSSEQEGLLQFISACILQSRPPQIKVLKGLPLAWGLRESLNLSKG